MCMLTKLYWHDYETFISTMEKKSLMWNLSYVSSVHNLCGIRSTTNYYYYIDLWISTVTIFHYTHGLLWFFSRSFVLFLFTSFSLSNLCIWQLYTHTHTVWETRVLFPSLNWTLCEFTLKCSLLMANQMGLIWKYKNTHTHKHNFFPEQ